MQQKLYLDKRMFNTHSDVRLHGKSLKDLFEEEDFCWYLGTTGIAILLEWFCWLTRRGQQPANLDKRLRDAAKGLQGRGAGPCAPAVS